MSAVFPREILPKHLAIFGMTGSGKSTTGRDLVEQVVPEGSRVCILDTVKSDWWGITSSADGKRAGLAFTILGGPKAHLPLSRHMGKAIGELVAAGAIPLSIIDMADFGPGDASHFFVDFAQALMKKMKGVLYLVIEEAHEIAPKERAGFDKENLGVYWAKRLATAGRTKGIRLVVLTQRTQSLHNAVIGSCETVVVHRMTAPADQKPVVDWLKGNIKDVALRKRIEESMASLADGQGYLCSGSAQIFDLKQFPRCKTFDNTATPEDDNALQEVKTARVDVEQLRTLLAASLREAEANDVPSLKRRIAELERDARNAKPAAPVAADHSKCVDRAQLGAIAEQSRKEGWDLAIANSKREHQRLVENYRKITDQAVVKVVEAAIGMFDTVTYVPTVVPVDGNSLFKMVPHRYGIGDGVALTSIAHPKGNGKTLRPQLDPTSLETIEIDLPLSGVQQRIVDTLTSLESMGADEPPAELICFMAGYSNLKSKGFSNGMSSLRTAGLVKGMRLTEEGRRAANPAPAPVDARELQEKLFTLLGGAARRVLEPLIEVYPDAVDKPELMKAAGYGHAKSKGFSNMLSRLRTLGFIDYEGGGVVAKPVLFLQ